jgi:hypothetical protein
MNQEALQFLARHLNNAQAVAPAVPADANRPLPYRITPAPAPQPVMIAAQPCSGNEMIARLQQQVRSLEQQLANSQNSGEPAPLTAQPVSTSWTTGGQLRPTTWISQPLQPAMYGGNPLQPANSSPDRMEWRHYYVGDLISPPFANSTFRLVQYLKMHVAPDSWDDAAIQITDPAVTLMIRQSPENHQRIDMILRHLQSGVQPYRQVIQ